MADIVELGLRAKTIGVDQSAAELDRLSAASDRAEKGAKGMEAASTKAAPAVRKVGQESDGAAPKVRKVGTEASKSGREIKGMGADAEAASRKVAVAGSSIDAAGKSAGANTLLFKNLAYQVNQVGQQGAATGQWMTALTIQVPDVLASFGSLPLVLAGGAAAVGASLLPALLSTEEATESLEERVDSLAAAFDRLARSQSASSGPASGLTGDFGARAEQARQLLQIETEIARVVAQRALLETSGSVANAFGDIAGETGGDVQAMLRALSTLEEGYDDALDIIYNPSRTVSDNPVIAQLAEDMGIAADEAVAKLSRFRNDLIKLQDDLDVTPAQADRLADALARMGTAEGLDGQIDAANDLALAIFDVTGGMEGMDQATLDLYQSLLEVAKRGQALQGLDMSAPLMAVERYTSRTTELNQLLHDRALAEQAAADAASGSDEEERARQAIDAIDEQIRATTDATGRLDDMEATLDDLSTAMDRVDFDGEGGLRAKVKEARDRLAEAGTNAETLGDADLTALERTMRSLAGLADRLMASTGQTVESLQRGVSLADAYGQYARTRTHSDRVTRARNENEAARSGILDLVGYAEGTDKGDGYNETLGYGAFTGGDVALTSMTLREVRALQRQMLAHPDNDFNSSAVGRYQIVGQTLDGLVDELKLSWDDPFDEATQDRMAMQLVRRRQGQGAAGYHNEWEGLRRVSDSNLTLALGAQSVPTVDKVTEQATARAAREAEQMENADERAFDQYRALISSMDEAAAAQIRFEDAQETINEALAAGKITADEAAAARSSASARLADDLAEAEKNSHAARDAYDALVSSLDPVVAATLRFAEAQEQINAALAAGEISAEEAARTTNLARAEMEESIEAAGRLAEASRTGGEYLGNMMNGLLDGSMSAKEAIGGLLIELAKVQMMKATLGLAGGGGFIGSAIGALGSALTVPSFDGGGYTGDGPRSGGIDGKGGYPAIVHPGEVIQDLTKGQGSGGYGGAGGTLEVVLRSDPGVIVEIARNEAGAKVRQEAPAIRNSAVNETARQMRTQPKGRFGL